MKAVTLRLLKALLRASKVYAAVKNKNVRFKSLKKERVAAGGIPPIIQEKGGITPASNLKPHSATLHLASNSFLPPARFGCFPTAHFLTIPLQTYWMSNQANNSLRHKAIAELMLMKTIMFLDCIFFTQIMLADADIYAMQVMLYHLCAEDNI